VNGTGQYVQIVRVAPASIEEIQDQPSSIPDTFPTPMQKYYAGNDVNIFVYSKPFKKSKEKSTNEFKDLWVLNTYYFTEDTFPTIHRRSLITKKQQKELDPLYNAWKAVKDKNKDIIELMQILDSNPDSPLNDFTMVLQGVIHAAVNGGTDNYKDAFFNQTYEKDHPQQVKLLRDLRDELVKQLAILEQALQIHKKLCGEAMLGLQELLEQKFVVMKEKSEGIAS